MRSNIKILLLLRKCRQINIYIRHTDCICHLSIFKIRPSSRIHIFTCLLYTSIPPLVPIPGIKLGLANIVTLVLIMNKMPKESAIVLLMRIILASIFAGQMLSFFYSLLGGFFCLGAMLVCQKLIGTKYIWFTSVIGAIFHNIGQLLAALITLQSIYVLYYAPFLLVSCLLYTSRCV